MSKLTTESKEEIIKVKSERVTFSVLQKHIKRVLKLYDRQ